jgi:putative membrane protein
MRVTLIVSLIISILMVVFALQNAETMEVNLLFVATEGSKALILIITFVVGVVVGLLSAMPGRVRDRREVKRLRKQLEQQTPPPASAGEASAGEASATPAPASRPSSEASGAGASSEPAAEASKSSKADSSS